MEIDSCGSFRHEMQHFCVMLKKICILLIPIICTTFLFYAQSLKYSPKPPFQVAKSHLIMGSLLKDNYKAMCMYLNVIKLYV